MDRPKFRKKKKNIYSIFYNPVISPLANSHFSVNRSFIGLIFTIFHWPRCEGVKSGPKIDAIRFPRAEGWNAWIQISKDRFRDIREYAVTRFRLRIEITRTPVDRPR